MMINVVKFLSKLKHILFFYRSFWLASAIINTGCGIAVFKFGLEEVAPCLWLKIFSCTIIYFLVNEYKKNEYYYYLNVGIGKRLLWSVVFVFDFLFSFLFLFIIYKIR
ncbi:hypothetical protein [Arachidicoccus ginsenosidimutans]|uniref:hypothetical protein n=1 Tax=Arachidicoccus sp. BS20 TaxID=1850526 RepID=UPI0012E9043B|nr:hypothetical protein [Arachidicoccus sp. BS20]